MPVMNSHGLKIMAFIQPHSKDIREIKFFWGGFPAKFSLSATGPCNVVPNGPLTFRKKLRGFVGSNRSGELVKITALFLTVQLDTGYC